MARPRKPYRGVLRRRLPDPKTAPMGEVLLAMTDRVFALYEHYEIDRTEAGAADALVMQMALDHVEGFKIAKPSGRRPTSEQVARDIKLFHEIWRTRTAGKPDSAAYRRLAKQWDVADGTLRKRFGELMKPSNVAAKPMRDLFKWIVEQTEESTDNPKKVAN